MRAAWLALALSAGLHAALIAWPEGSPSSGSEAAIRPARLEARLQTALSPATGRATQTKPLADLAPAAADLGPVPRAAVAPNANAMHAQTAPPDYWPAAMLERSPVPVSAPDTRMLQGADLPAGTLRIELFIDSAGQVRVVRPAQQAGQMPAELPEPIVDMFLATRFLPGQRGGLDVPSRVTLEISIQDLLHIS